MGLDDVLAYLTFRERFARKRVRFERRSGALVLQVEGSPAPVRQWLGDLLRSYRGIVPVNNPSDVPAGHDEEGLVVEQLQAMTEDAATAAESPTASPSSSRASRPRARRSTNGSPSPRSPTRDRSAT